MVGHRIIHYFGKKIPYFFYVELRRYWQNIIYYRLGKSRIEGKTFRINKSYEIEAKKYWKSRTGKSISTMWHSYYSYVNGIEDVRYVPENLYYGYIEPYYNRIELAEAWDDKCYYSERFPKEATREEIKRPKVLLRNVGGIYFDELYHILSEEEACSLLFEQTEGYVIKAAIDVRGGKNLTFVEPGEKKTIEEIKQNFLHYKEDFVIEALITQCAEMAALNPSSINTLRFITYMDRGGVHLLSVCARIGRGHSRTDNFSSGGISCGVDENGVLKSVAYDQMYNKYEIHPDGQKFAGIKVPNYDEARRVVTALHRRFGHFRIISWDIAISSDYTPILIEFNLTPQSIDLHQINNGPIFGDLTEGILEEVFRSKRKKES